MTVSGLKEVTWFRKGKYENIEDYCYSLHTCEFRMFSFALLVYNLIFRNCSFKRYLAPEIAKTAKSALKHAILDKKSV